MNKKKNETPSDVLRNRRNFYCNERQTVLSGVKTNFLCTKQYTNFTDFAPKKNAQVALLATTVFISVSRGEHFLLWYL